MVDLHSHILPGIDDGAATVEESVDLARRLETEGVRTVAATPHIRADHPLVVPSELGALCAKLNERLAGEGIAVQVVPAAEVDLVWTMDAEPSQLELVSYMQQGTDLLLECPYGPLPHFFDEQVFQLAVRGYRILLAHPERNPTFRAEPQRLRELVERGVLVQLTASSLAASPRESRSARAAADFLTQGLAHVIASDAHGRAAPGRDAIGPGLAVARELVGDRADWMMNDAPAAILAGCPLPMPPPLRERKRLRLKR